MSSLKSRINALAFSSGIILFGRVFGKFASIAALAVMARGLDGEEFGTVMLAYTIAMIVGLIAVIGIPNGLASLLPKFDSGKKDRILIAGLTFSVGGGLFGLLLLVLFREELATLTDEPQLAEILLPFAVFACLFGISKSVVGALRGHKLSFEATVSRDIIAETIALLFLIVWFFNWRSLDGVFVYWCLIPLIAIITGLAMFALSGKKIDICLPDIRDYQEVLKFSWPLSVESGFVVLMSNIDVILIGVFLTTTSVGIYKAAQPIAMSMVIILTSFTFLYLPLASEMFDNRELKDLNEIYKICTKWIITFSIPITVIIVGYADTILSIIYKPSFSSGGTALSILTIGVFLRTFFGPNGAMIKAISKTIVDLYASAAALIVNLVLNFLLIPTFGMEGAAIATAIGFTVFNLIEVGVTYWKLQMHPISRNNITMVISVVTIGFVAKYILSDSIMSLIIFSIIVGSTSLFSALVMSGSETERRLLRDLRSSLSGILQ
ncbi:flippase [Haloarcula sp. CBA1130]|uniref:flippase n=1 Tax=unclassified Haloarcula TaxID=2624677 RepID=UPI0012482C23|nr:MULTISPECIES: flippase [unclassified Haloarcula]KAA9397856.1 flippase [Haloarcula sp. CBA1129]KAA9402456.1 flippase [Haloarcula sp. CBA1130]